MHDKFNSVADLRLNNYQEWQKSSEKQNWTDFLVRSQRLQDRLKKETMDKLERHKYNQNERNNKFKEKQERAASIKRDAEAKRKDLERKWKKMEQKAWVAKNETKENGEEHAVRAEIAYETHRVKSLN